MLRIGLMGLIVIYLLLVMISAVIGMKQQLLPRSNMIVMIASSIGVLLGAMIAVHGNRILALIVMALGFSGLSVISLLNGMAMGKIHISHHVSRLLIAMAFIVGFYLS